MRRICSAVALLLVIFLLTGVLGAQINRGTITGTVTDPSGAVLPEVQVVVTNTATGAVYEGITNQLGIYSILNLPVGSYSVRFNREGFVTLDRTALSLITAQVLEINIKLEVGSAQEIVTVTTEPPLVQSETSHLGMTIQSRAIRDLPLNASGGRDASNLFYSTVPTMQGGLYQDHIAGSNSFSKTIMIDGVDGNSGLQGFVQTPGMEAIQEMQAQVSGIGSEGAGTGGGVLLYELKSGTNKFHGSAFGFVQNEALNANTWNNNYWLVQCARSDKACAKRYGRARDRFNDWGLSGGAPLWKDHTFVFAAFERYASTDLRQDPTGATVPTAKMLTGDFSELLTEGAASGSVLTSSNNPCTNQPYKYGQIFDPQTWTTVNGVPCARPFDGNIIPSNRLSALSQNLAAIYQQYYSPTVSGKVTNNYPSLISGAPWWNKTNFDIKVDHHFSDRHHVSASFNYFEEPMTTASGLFNLEADGGPFSSSFDQKFMADTFRVIDSYAPAPNLLNAFSVSMNLHSVHETPHNPANLADYAFGGEGSVNFPAISFGGSNGITEAGIGTTTQDRYAMFSLHLQDTVAWTKGRHTIKFGGKFTAQQHNSTYGGNAQSYIFSNITGGPIDGSITSAVGSGFANFMLGAVQSASVQLQNPSYGRRKLFDLFVQDDIRVTPKFTMNTGLRWDVNFPFHEKYGHWTNWNTSVKNPNWGGHPGAWEFATSGEDTFEKNNDFTQFGPHIGAAYQLANRLVVRGAYGIFYVPLGMNQWYGQSNPGTQNYFYVGTNEVVNNVAGSTAFNWDNGYPGQTVYIDRTSDQTYIGNVWPIQIDPNELHLGWTQNWNVGIEYEFAKNFALNVNYVGNRGQDLHDGNLLAYQNYPDWDTYHTLWSSGHIYDIVSDSTTATAAGVPYPYEGFNSYAWAAISPYPQLAATSGRLVSNAGAPVGVSAYNSLVVEVRSKNAHGVTMDMSYTLSKATGSVSSATNFWNAGTTYWYQTMEEYKNAGDNVLGFDRRHIFKGYITYDLPFGRGKKLFTQGVLNQIFGGWTIGFQPTYQSGAPLGGVSSSLVYPGWMGLRADMVSGAKLGNHFKILTLGNLRDSSNEFFSASDFANPQNGELGNSPYIYNDWRSWAHFNEDLSVMKNFSFGKDDRYRATLRAEFFNVFNRHTWGDPDMYIGSIYFGKVTSVSGNRIGQLGARFEW